MDNINELIGFRIRVLREERDLSQEKLGALGGLHRAYIGQVERGEKNVGLKNLQKIARALNVPIQVLLDTSPFDT